MKLQILVPQYNETDCDVKNLLDSIALQQSVNFNEIGVIICNDGSDVILSDSLLQSYPFKIEYYLEEHKGVSATRNFCLDKSTADYVMFCDADDMFYNMCGLWILFKEMNIGFNVLISAFTEEGRHPETKEVVYITHDVDLVFVHGKIYNRKYLIDKNIRWNDNLTVHEDSYFNILAQKLCSDTKHCPTPFYLWKWRDNSVCRHDDKYILKTFNNMIDSNDALVEEFINRNDDVNSSFYIAFMIFESYYMMNKPEWIDQENQQYRIATEKRFSQYYKKYKDIWEAYPDKEKMIMSMQVRDRNICEGMQMESMTVNGWINHIENNYEN